MQLKRDTDYALRILYCLKLNNDDRGADTTHGMTLTEIAAQTGTPKIVAGRVCENLKENGMIQMISEQEAAERVYASDGTLLNTTLLDVIEAVEGTGQLFAVFDKRSAVYKNCEMQIQNVQKRTDKVLARATLGKLFEQEPGF